MILIATTNTPRSFNSDGPEVPLSSWRQVDTTWRHIIRCSPKIQRILWNLPAMDPRGRRRPIEEEMPTFLEGEPFQFIFNPLLYQLFDAKHLTRISYRNISSEPSKTYRSVFTIRRAWVDSLPADSIFLRSKMQIGRPPVRVIKARTNASSPTQRDTSEITTADPEELTLGGLVGIAQELFFRRPNATMVEFTANGPREIKKLENIIDSASSSPSNSAPVSPVDGVSVGFYGDEALMKLLPKA